MELIAALVASGIGLAAACGWVVRRTRGPIQLGRERYASLDAFLALVGAEVGLTGSRRGTRAVLSNARFSGSCEGRPASIDFFTTWEGESPVEYARLAVAAGDGVHLKVSPETLVGRLVKRLGKHVGDDLGDPELAARFMIEAADGDSARRAVRAGMGNELAAAFDRDHVARLELDGTQVVAIVPASLLEPRAIRPLLARLARLGELAEGAQLRVVLRGRADGHARCGFCHEELSASEGRELAPSDVLACASCGALLHVACWREHGRCPVFGCRGEQPGERLAEGA